MKNILDFSHLPDFESLNTQIPWQASILSFWKEWKNEKDYIKVKTSGSTGTPKMIRLKKEAVLSSAKATCDFFDLYHKDSALLCLPADFIAGKMMLVRAEMAKIPLYLCEPKLHIYIDKPIDFCAMTPSQCWENLYDMHYFNTILLGGEKVQNQLVQELEKWNIKAYESYGMTETISHIALKKLPEEMPWFTPMKDVGVELDKEGCLVIEAPYVDDQRIHTHDLAEINKQGQFQIKGRIDHVINSGGIKISPEILESKIKEKYGIDCVFFGEKDAQFGERVAMIIKKGNDTKDIDYNTLGFKKIEIPHTVYVVDDFVLTDNGKLNRRETLKKLNK